MAEVHNSWWFTKYFYNFNCVITYNMKGGYLYQRYYIIMHDWNTYFEPGYVFHTYNSSHCTVQRPREQWPTLTAPHPFYTQWNTTKWLVSWLAYFMIIWCILCKSPTPLIMYLFPSRHYQWHAIDKIHFIHLLINSIYNISDNIILMAFSVESINNCP